mgnify:CR=1 FL=1
MRFLLDQNLPINLCARLHQWGHEALHVEALGMGEASDRQVWGEASRLEAVVVSKDSDFLRLAASGGRLVHMRIGNCSNRVLFEIVDRSWPAVVQQLEIGERVVEVRV